MKLLQRLLTKRVLLILIVLLALVLRFYQLGAIPPSLTWDEVALGYNSYALSIDGRDEFGKLLPYDYLLSFGDYKPPMYSYLGVLPVMLFGLTEFAVRFPSALFGTLSVLVTYLLVKRLFVGSKRVEYYALAAAFFLAISPWHIMLSRAAFEANIATFFIMTGVWLFLLGIQKKPIFLIVSTIVFILSLYTFNSTRIVAPLLLLVLAIAHFRSLLKLKKYVISAGIIGLILVLPILQFLVSPEAKLRYAEVNIFSDISIVETANQEVANDNNAWWSKIIHNRRVAYAREVTTHYFDHFNPSFLFISGDENPKFSTHDVGQMYLWDLPFLVIGILFLLRKREGKWWFIPVWLLIAIIPAAVARETPHALRIESSLPTWQILTAYGFVTFVFALNRFKKLIITFTAAILLGFLVYFLHGYYYHYAREYSTEWQYSYKNVIHFVKDNEKKYDRVVISDELERPYIYTLFYLQYPPQQFRKEAKIRGNDFGFVHVDSFGKYVFAGDMTKVSADTKTLYIAGVKNLPKDVKVVKEFYLLNGKKLFIAYTY